MEDTKKQAKKNGFVETMKGRKIYLPNISHSNFQVEVLLKELLSMLQFKVLQQIF